MYNKEHIKTIFFICGFSRFCTHNKEERFYINDWLERLVSGLTGDSLVIYGSGYGVNLKIKSARIGVTELGEKEILAIGELRSLIRFWLVVHEYDYTLCVKGLNDYTLRLLNSISAKIHFENLRSVYSTINLIIREEVDGAI